MKNGKIKAIIFDFDGLMVNTEELRLLSFEEFIKTHGKKFKKVDYVKTMPGSAEETTQLLKDLYSLEGDIAILNQQRRDIFKNLFDNRLVFMEGVAELLVRIKNWDVKCAVASGRRRGDIVDALTRFDVIDQFETIVSLEDLAISKGKPDPEIYLIAAKRLGLDPKFCLALEDSPFGIDSAKAAGMRAVYVPDARFFDLHHEKADIILKNLGELTDDILEMLAK